MHKPVTLRGLILTLLIFTVFWLLIIGFILDGLCYAEEYVPTGFDLNCREINYRSSDCMKARAVDMKYIEKEVAIAEAQSNKTVTNEEHKVCIINQAKEESKKKDDIIFASYMEEVK